MIREEKRASLIRWGRWSSAAVLVGVFGLAASGCQVRDEKWDYGVGGLSDAVELSGSVVLQDKEMDRFLFLSSDSGLKLTTTALPVGQNISVVQPSADRSKLFVLSSGVFPRLNEEDEGPRLTVFDGGSEPKVEKIFELDDPMTRLAVDPQGEWVAAYSADATVTNDNELVLFSLKKDDDEPRPRSIRSFGGSPVELVFTDELLVPDGGARRFLLVRTDRDVTIIDLKNLSRPEVTVKLPERANGQAYVPDQLVYDDGDPEVDDDAQIAIRLQATSDVVMLSLGKADDEGKDFKVNNNIVDVGGVPTSIEFVRTDGGLRLAALVPTALRATLVNPKTIQSEAVELPAGFNQMTRITSDVAETPEDGDVALLWGAGTDIAFWSLGETSSTPFRSLDTNSLSFSVEKVIDVPAPNSHYKVLEGASGSGFFVLDLKKRQSFPLSTRTNGYSVQASSDGERLWISRSGSSQFSTVSLDDLHPSELYVEPDVEGLFDIEQADGGRAVVIVHQQDGWSATVMDALDPNSANTAHFPALELEDF